MYIPRVGEGEKADGDDGDDGDDDMNGTNGHANLTFQGDRETIVMQSVNGQSQSKIEISVMSGYKYQARKYAVYLFSLTQ